MITTDVIEKEKYTSPTKGKLTNIPTFLNSKLFEKALTETNEFKRSVVRNQWRYAKENLKRHPNVRTILQVGDLYDLKDNYKRAIDYYLEALLLDSENLGIYKKIIDILVKHKQFEEAEQYFKKLLSISNRFEILKDYVFFKVISWGDFSNIDSLIELLDQTLEKDKNDIDLISLKGFLLLNFKNEIDLAKILFERCLEINSNYIHAINNLGVCLLRKKENKKAEKYFQLGLEVDPYNYPFTYQNLTNVYLSEHKDKEAIDLLEIAIFKNVSIGNEYNHVYGWLLLNDLQLDKAKLWYQGLIKKEPDNNLLYNNLGVCYSREKNTDMAIKFFQKAIDLCKDQLKKGVIKDSRSLHAFYNRGRIAIQKNDPQTLREVSENIHSLDPNNAYGHYFLGSFFLKREEYSKASVSFEKALSIDKHIPELYPDYSFVLESIQKEYQKAISLLKQGAELGYKNDYIFNNLAFGYIKAGELKEGEKIINDHEDSPLATFIATRGLLEMKRNNLKNGTEFYKKAIDLLVGFDKIVASKILETEIADYWFRQKNFPLAQEHINKAKSMEKTYMDFEVEELEQKIKLSLAK